MAKKIDTGSEPQAHTAIQAMIGRAHIAANRDHRRVGIVCDLFNDQVAIIDMGNECPDAEYLRVIEPGVRAEVVVVQETDCEVVDRSIDAEELQYC